MKFIAKRLFTAVITLLIVSLMTFAAFNIIPGDPAVIIAGTSATEEQVDNIRRSLGLDRSLGEQYISWLGDFIFGDGGISIKYNIPVKEMVSNRVGVTFSLAALSLFFVILIALPVSIFTSRREGSTLDRITNMLTGVSVSIPGFFLGIIFIWVFSLILHVFTSGAYVPFEVSPLGFFVYLIFPALSVAIPSSAMVIKFLRSSIFHQFGLDYVRTAYSKGNTHTGVLINHVLKNALIPALTFLGMIVGDIFGGSIVVEQVFGIPGIGRLLITSIGARDFPLVQTLVLYTALIVVAANTAVDILIRLIDPRIRNAA